MNTPADGSSACAPCTDHSALHRACGGEGGPARARREGRGREVRERPRSRRTRNWVKRIRAATRNRGAARKTPLAKLCLEEGSESGVFYVSNVSWRCTSVTWHPWTANPAGNQAGPGPNMEQACTHGVESRGMAEDEETHAPNWPTRRKSPRFRHLIGCLCFLSLSTCAC